jgi:hypothetical protein
VPYPQRGPTDDNEEEKMTALHLIRDGLSTAAELAALLFMAPIATAAAAESHSLPAVMPAATAEAPVRTAERTLRPLHLVDGAVEMRLLGLLADLRVVQTVHNAGAHPVDLGAQLRAAGDGVDSIAVVRDGHAVDVLNGGDCGGEDLPHGGHAHAEIDERIAELMQLPPGARATIEITTTETLQPAGPVWRVALPATVVPVRAQALLVSEPQGHYVVVVPPAGASGVVTLTLRPMGTPPLQLQFGPVDPGTAYVIPAGSAQALAGLHAGAIEMEVQGTRDVQWTTLSVLPRGLGAAAFASSMD